MTGQFDKITDDQRIRKILQRCVTDTSFHEHYFFPETFYTPTNAMHKQIDDLINTGHPRIAIAAPRGVGKTSKMNIGLASKRILFRLSNFILYISQSADNAMAQTENLKRELVSNEKVRMLFGSIKAKDVNDFAEYDESFSKKIWTAFDTLVLPRGRGQQVRGLLYKSRRPDYILIDDLEEADMMGSEIYRAKLKQWFYADVMKAISKYDSNYQIIYIDTLKHEDSLLQELLDSPDWLSIRLEACDDDLNPTAPDYMTREEIEREYREHERGGKLDVFFREYRNLPISTADPVFHSDSFRYVRDRGDHWEVVSKDDEAGAYISQKEEIKKQDLFMVTIVDPAKTQKLHSAESAVVTFGVHRSDRRIILCSVISGKFRPDELYDNMFDEVRFHNSRILAVEVTSLHDFISQPIENEMRVRGCFAQYVELNATGKKEDRVAHLAPYYRQGYIYHNVVCAQKAESQLLGYPRSKYWDVMDAMAYIVKLMDKLAIYFDPIDIYEDSEAEFEELEDEGMMELNLLC